MAKFDERRGRGEPGVCSFRRRPRVSPCRRHLDENHRTHPRNASRYSWLAWLSDLVTLPRLRRAPRLVRSYQPRPTSFGPGTIADKLRTADGHIAEDHLLLEPTGVGRCAIPIHTTHLKERHEKQRYHDVTGRNCGFGVEEAQADLGGDPGRVARPCGQHGAGRCLDCEPASFAQDRWLGIALGRVDRAEGQDFQAVLSPFESETGININYSGKGSNMDTAIDAAVAGGSPPQVALVPDPSTLIGLAKKHAIQPLAPVIGSEASDYGQRGTTLSPTTASSTASGSRVPTRTPSGTTRPNSPPPA